MNRRYFLKTLGKATLASTFPYILPSGRLFAKTSSQLASHIVVVLLGNGLRWQETIGQGYLQTSQYELNPLPENNISGNIMPNLLTGNTPTQKIVFGIDPPDIGSGGQAGSLLVTPIVQQALQTQGILFGNMYTPSNDYYPALSTLLTGNNNNIISGNRPSTPTIFEYVRRYMGVSALQTWYIGSDINHEIPLLNYSTDAAFGVKYAANFMSPKVLFGEKGANYFGNIPLYDPYLQTPYMNEMRQFLDQNIANSTILPPDIGNSEADRYEINQFIHYLYNKGKEAITAVFPSGMLNNDLSTIAYTCELLGRIKPTLTVVNLADADIAHSNFTQYLQSIYRADYGIAYLWQYIQQTTGMANDTCLLIVSDFGRNATANNMTDNNAWQGYDHDDSNNSHRTFSLLLCPNLSGNQVIGDVANPKGDNRHIALTIAEVLGIKEQTAAINNIWSNESLIDLL